MNEVTTIERLNHQGDGIGKINNKIIFVPKTLPGEVVKITSIKEYKKYSKALSYEIIKKSVNRQDYKCPYYDKCGGCKLGHMSYSSELLFKKEKVENILKKYTTISMPIEIVGSPQESAYRNKVTLHIKDGKLGYYQENSHNLISIANCLLLTPKTNMIIRKIEDNLSLGNNGDILIRDTKRETLVSINSSVDIVKTISLLKDDVDSLYINNILVYGSKNIKEELQEYQFNISKESFFQVNTNQALNLYKEALKLANPTNKDSILDLYCGTGSIGIYMAKKCKSVYGIEINKQAIIDAFSNAKLNHVNNITFEAIDAKVINQRKVSFAITIVDPPRAGLSKEVVSYLNRSKTKKIIYISCNPITLARDLNRLKEYRVRSIKLFDLFPRTEHVEVVVLLTLKNS